MVVAAPPADPVLTYAQAVLAGEIVAGPYVRLACQRHLRDLEDGHKRGLVWDQDEADLAFEFFSLLRLPEGELDESGEIDGRPFELIGWEQFIVGSVWGWRLEDGSRRFRTAYIEAGKGNGKTPLAGGVGLKGAVADRQAVAEVYTAGVTRDQASYLLLDIRAMALASPALKRRLEVGAHHILDPRSRSVIKPVSSEARSLDQKRVHMALIDELHEHPSGVVVNKMRAGTKGRRDALIFEITNSGYDRNSICWQHHEMSIKVLEGTIENDAWFAYVCALDEGDDWTDEAVWPKANPSLGVTITHRYLREQVEEALAMPSNQNLVKRLNFCIWTESVTKWLDAPAFVQAAEVEGPAPLPRAREAFAGLDIASTDDLSALNVVAPRPRCSVPDHDGRCYDVRCLFWLPEARLQRRVDRDHVPYDVWARDGWIRLTRGNRQDQEQIARDTVAYLTPLSPQAVGIDRWNSAWITPKLQDEDLEVVEVGQGFASLSEPAKRLEADIVSGFVHHDGNPVLAWMVGNAIAETDPAGNIKPSRGKSIERIDGVAAWCDALYVWLNQPEEEDEEADGYDGYRGDLTV